MHNRKCTFVCIKLNSQASTSPCFSRSSPFWGWHHSTALHCFKQTCWNQSWLLPLSHPLFLIHHPVLLFLSPELILNPCILSISLLTLDWLALSLASLFKTASCLASSAFFSADRDDKSHHSLGNNPLITYCYANIQHTYLHSLWAWCPGPLNMHPSLFNVLLGSLCSSNYASEIHLVSPHFRGTDSLSAAPAQLTPHFNITSSKMTFTTSLTWIYNPFSSYPHSTPSKI